MEKVIEQYKKVFDEEGNVKLCGREACKKLIELCSEIVPNVDFSSLESGFMNVKNIQEFVKEYL